MASIRRDFLPADLAPEIASGQYRRRHLRPGAPKPSPRPKPSSNTPPPSVDFWARSAGSRSSIPPSAISSTASPSIPRSKASATSSRPSPTRTWHGPRLQRRLAQPRPQSRLTTSSSSTTSFPPPSASSIAIPTRSFVLDHIAKPPILSGELRLGRATSPTSPPTQCFCKLSGVRH